MCSAPFSTPCIQTIVLAHHLSPHILNIQTILPFWPYSQTITPLRLTISLSFTLLSGAPKIVISTELLIYTHSHILDLAPIIIHDKTVERVNHFKYLGLTLDNKLTFEQHVTDIYKRSQQRLHILRKLHALSVTPHLLLLLYTSIIQSILLYCSPCYFNMLSITNRNKLIKVTRTASKIISLPITDLSLLNSKAVTRMAWTVSRDSDHPLHIYFSLLPSGRRYRTLRWRRARFSKSFVPSAIAALNNL